MWFTGSAGLPLRGRSPTGRRSLCWGWRGGDRLTLTGKAGVMIARRDPGGIVTVPSRPYGVIPGALRSLCGLRAGDNVLLAASPQG
jgi:hypothetical protein